MKNRFFKLTIVLVAVTALIASLAALTSAATFSAWEPAKNAESVPGTSSVLNTVDLEGCPGISRDDLSLYFASSRPGGLGGTDIWVSQRAKPSDAWGAPVNVRPLNSSANDLCPTPLNGGWFLFVSARAGGCGGDDMYVTYNHPQKGWLEPQNLGCQVNSAGNEASPSLVEQGWETVLYFSSTRPGGFAPEAGGATADMDIYSSRRLADGSFGAATLVPGMNTAADDSRPNVRKDGLEMVFDSTRPGGLGGPDIWSTRRTSLQDAWSAPVNLGSAVNSPDVDVRAVLSADGKTLFFGSTRSSSEGNQDLYFSTRERTD
ncbi:MAG TPA: hypothetical protein VJB57_03940 [Dehalococcoidia bacterium]|nr:hypothetical protein [Dehalococcoidia bacterium]